MGMKIGLLQMNPTVGDIAGNVRAMAQAHAEAVAAGAQLCVTSELAVCGYPPKDLLLYRSFIAKVAAAVRELAAAIDPGVPLLAGGVAVNPAGQGRPLYNCAFLLTGGAVGRIFGKTLLPTYDVFDEDRYFEPYAGLRTFDLNGRTVGVTICEDIWNDKGFRPARRYGRDPLEELVPERPEVVVNLSASPFCLGKQSFRQSMLGGLAAKHRCHLIYVNQAGGNDDLVFDGRSAAYGPDGALYARCAPFAAEVRVIDTGERSGGLAEDDFTPPAETWAALVAGTRDYVRKSCFSGVLLGLSGGIDSALTAAVAAQALGPEQVLGVLMPSPFSSQGSLDDSLELARRLNIRTLTLPIAPVMAAFEGALAGAFAGLPRDVTEENIQARIRGNLLMALSNKHRMLLLTTGNKSELAVGYCTIYGDMSGGYAVISDVPKTLVYAVSRHVNLVHGGPIPEAIITKAPSAELRPDQKDQDSLPPYEILDEILRLHIEDYRSAEEIAAAGFEPETVAKVLKLVKGAEFKRWQAAPGIKISERAFGTGWRMPLACVRPL